MRQHYKPMLAETADSPFSSEDWIFEVKWDGIRALSYIDADGTVSLRSRNNLELRQNFPELWEMKDLIRDAVLDGEIILMEGGKADFQGLMERCRSTSAGFMAEMSNRSPATYVVFDMLEKDGEALVDRPLMERKQMLKQHLGEREGGSVVLSLFVEGRGEAYYDEAIKRGVEGIMAKRKDSAYEQGRRSPNWLKIKKLLTCDCVVFGYTKGEGARGETFGALILGLYGAEGTDGKGSKDPLGGGREHSKGEVKFKEPVYVGKVGTGFTDEGSRRLLEELKPIISAERTLKGVDALEEITWVKPRIVCEVVYQNVTRDGRLRMPRFKRVRFDKGPSDCTTEQLEGRLKEYEAKRDFGATPEPSGMKSGEVRGKLEEEGAGRQNGLMYVVQEHHARRLHYDLRLERGGVLKSWAVPKGLPEKPGEKRLAIETEDHPLEYGGFEGEIPQGEYGAGKVIIWDRGTYKPIFWGEDMIEFIIEGGRVQGRYVLTRFKKAGDKQWLLLRAGDKIG
jgi:DNA ligase D-like protein (predicted 3'-phosphoesterase)